jgi:type VI secretion system secreted protein Hcp
MPNPIYVWFEGTKQGPYGGWGSWAGEDDQKGREGSSLVQQFEHEVTSPRDTSTGLASGMRVHRPVRIVKRIDKASPRIYQSLVQNEHLKKVEFKWYRIAQSGAGGQEHYFTTLLEDAVIAAVKEWFPLTVDEDYDHYSHFEDVSIVYRRITWTWQQGGVTTTDDWQERDS